MQAMPSRKHGLFPAITGWKFAYTSCWRKANLLQQRATGKKIPKVTAFG